MLHGKTNAKQMGVVSRLREGIVGGRLAPGSKLPTYDELESSFAVSRGTLFHAIRELKQDGLLESHGRRGVFVSASPPHLNRYGLVMPPATRPDDPLHGAYLAAANALKQSGICEIAIYHDPDEQSCDEDYRRLLRDVQSHRVAGLLFFGRPWPRFDLQRSPVLHAEGVPCLALTAHVQPGITAMRTNMARAIEKGCRWLRERGRRRVAVLALGKIETLPLPMDLPSLIRPYGFDTREKWCAMLGAEGEGAAGAFVQLMLDGRDDIPDALFLFDEHLLPAAARTLLANRQVTVGKDFDVVSLCNWPWVPETALPIRWIGFDAHDILRQAMALIDCARAGETLPTHVSVEPYFEEERMSAAALFGTAFEPDVEPPTFSDFPNACEVALP